MKPLEGRRWFILLSLAVSVLVIAGMIEAAGLPFVLPALPVYMFAVLGLLSGLNRLLAVAVIRVVPALGEIG